MENLLSYLPKLSPTERTELQKIIEIRTKASCLCLGLFSKRKAISHIKKWWWNQAVYDFNDINFDIANNLLKKLDSKLLD